MAARLNLLTGLYDVTADTRWLDAAKREGDHALRAFVHASGLIRGTAVVDRPDYYDAIQGPGALALELYRLGQFDSGSVRPAPISPREQPAVPRFDEWAFPHSASNATPLSVSVRIQPGPVEGAVLHYTYGNRVGMENTKPVVKGGQYSFQIAPPGIAFIGEVSFAVEVFTASGRTLSPWKRLRLETREIAASREGRVRFAAIPLRLSSVASGQQVRARMSRWLPEGVKAPPAGWVSAGFYIQLKGPATAERIEVDYLPEDTWRLIEPTLALAFWDGRDWIRAPSRLQGRTVSAPWRQAEHWTLLGEDRVLWRAPGRETGPALADLDGDGTLEVATTMFQPAQLLSSRGQLSATLPLDPPTRPVNNSSSPLVIRVDGHPLVIVGAPSGYVYAFDAKGARLWRAEVGGEVLGGPAAGPLLPGGHTGIAVSWGGGVSVFDRKGARVWQKALPVGAASTPVLIDLDGDGLDEIVLNAEDRIVAMAGATGRQLWSFRSPGRRLGLPAAGEFTRGAPPSIVMGDDAGSVYALNRTGTLLWRQDRLFGPREVPEPVEDYAAVSEVGMADLSGTGERRIVVTTRAGETLCLSARGERLWHFSSYERRVGTSLNNGGRLAFADLDGDGKAEVVVSQQDSFVHVLDHEGNVKWRYLGYFWYHFAPSIGDLTGNGELNIVFTSPEEGGTYALRTGFRGRPGRAPWPMMRGGAGRTNCAPW
ncbi:MAG: PQQ-binding-like beta-propeller repeat protein, partial [Bryobacteraceae bacterium]